MANAYMPLGPSWIARKVTHPPPLPRSPPLSLSASGGPPAGQPGREVVGGQQSLQTFEPVTPAQGGQGIGHRHRQVLVDAGIAVTVDGAGVAIVPDGATIRPNSSRGPRGRPDNGSEKLRRFQSTNQYLYPARQGKRAGRPHSRRCNSLKARLGLRIWSEGRGLQSPLPGQTTQRVLRG